MILQLLNFLIYFYSSGFDWKITFGFLHSCAVLKFGYLLIESSDLNERLKEWGKVVASHPWYAFQVVICSMMSLGKETICLDFTSAKSFLIRRYYWFLNFRKDFKAHSWRREVWQTYLNTHMNVFRSKD